MPPFFRSIFFMMLVAGLSEAYYMPVYTPIYIPTTPSGPNYRLEAFDKMVTTKEPGSDTLVRVGDTVGLSIATPKLSSQISSPAPVQGWVDSIPSSLDSVLRRSVGLAATFATAIPGSSIDTLKLKSVARVGGNGRGGSVGVESPTQPKTIELPRPSNAAGAKTTLVVLEQILPRKVVPEGAAISKVADLQVAWGLWNSELARWVAWGLVPLRTSGTDLSSYSALAVADKIGKSILDEAPLPSSISDIRRSERKSKYGGLLLGGYLQGGAHTSGDMKNMVKSLSSDYSATEFEFGFEGGWYQGAWGVNVSIPFAKSVSVDETYTDMYGEKHTNSAKMFKEFAPSASLVGLLPVGPAAITGAIGFGYMSLEGDAEFWQGTLEGSGTFWYPKIGFYLPGKHIYFATDLGLQFQKYDFGGADLKSTVFLFDMRFGLRLAHD